MTDCHSAPSAVAEIQGKTRVPLIALAGQPNLGKSTLFNLLTGLNQHVGNWPGKTVERREGRFDLDGEAIRLVDLPGTYSLTANSPEELIAREFIVREQPDVVVAVVSAANLERSLYLLAELLALHAPVVVALNMMDVARQEGIVVEPEVLQAAIGVPIIPMVAVRADGARELLRVVQDTLHERRGDSPHPPEIRADHKEALERIAHLIAGHVPQPYPLDWTALKLLEGDAEMTRLLQSATPTPTWAEVEALLRQHDDAMLAVASGRYEWIGRMVRAAVVRPRLGQVSLTNRLDQFATHPVLGLVILAGILGLIFWLTFTIGSPIQAWMAANIVHGSATLLGNALSAAPGWVQGLVVQGVIGGAGAVLTFLPIMAIFFLAFGLLEDTGYMARAGFVMDNLMHVMGLHGKSFLPLFLGFGCNVPAVIGTRVIDSPRARLLTILITPLVPCSARLGIIAFLAPAFFGPRAVLVSWGLILLSMLLLIGVGWVLNLAIFRGKRSAFIMEMPLYHLPNARSIGLLVWQRLWSFVSKAGTTILSMAVVVWALSVLPHGDFDTSFLMQFGRLVAPLANWMGLDWRLAVALIASFPAKENAIAALGVIFGNQNTGLAQTLASTYTPATALAFMVASMIFIPCAPTVASMRAESGSWKWTLLGSGTMLAVAILASGFVYRLAAAAGL